MLALAFGTLVLSGLGYLGFNANTLCVTDFTVNDCQGAPLSNGQWVVVASACITLMWFCGARPQRELLAERKRKRFAGWTLNNMTDRNMMNILAYSLLTCLSVGSVVLRTEDWLAVRPPEWHEAVAYVAYWHWTLADVFLSVSDHTWYRSTDFVVMLTHHIVTPSLIYLSWVHGFTGIGLNIMFLMSVSDVFLYWTLYCDRKHYFSPVLGHNSSMYWASVSAAAAKPALVIWTLTRNIGLAIVTWVGYTNMSRPGQSSEKVACIWMLGVLWVCCAIWTVPILRKGCTIIQRGPDVLRILRANFSEEKVEKNTHAALKAMDQQTQSAVAQLQKLLLQQPKKKVQRRTNKHKQRKKPLTMN